MPLHKHLSRLDQVWVTNPRYFITVCTYRRGKILANDAVLSILQDEWREAWGRHGWAVGSYVVMPDHVHFFCTDGERGTTLSRFVGAWKEWTAKKLIRDVCLLSPIWQKGFFDHLLRSSESYSEKWSYIQNNPMRAGFVACPEDWPYQGHVHYV